MDTEEIATEIVKIRRRLAEFDHGDQTADLEERTRLHDRLRHLQDVMAGRSSGEGHDSAAQPGSVHYVPPA